MEVKIYVIYFLLNWINFLETTNLVTAESLQKPSDYQLVLDSQSIYLQSSNHKRIKRFAAPILNDIDAQKTVAADILLDTNDVDKYYNSIRPTAADKEYYELINLTKHERMPKDLSFDNHFKLEQNQLMNNNNQNSSSSNLLTAEQIKPTKFSSMSQSTTAIATNQPRQNQNPDIQDIITGIVKLLNGNVNVHANTQPPQIPPSRRPFATRINNRGPPRISEAQPLPNDFIDQQQQQQILQQTIRPPPYPFDRPEPPIRPFINGVPIPEQIVPSMQQNYRPGFVSQNRPPWQRPRPRPPITSVNRRPGGIPYKTYPAFPPGYSMQNEYQTTTTTYEQNEQQQQQHLHTNTVSVVPDTENYEIADEISDAEESTTTDVIKTTTSNNDVPTKEDLYKKKEKIKMNEKKPIPSSSTMIDEIQPTMTTAHFITSDSTKLPSMEIPINTEHSIEPSTLLESSIEDISFPSIITSSTQQIIVTETPTLTSTEAKQTHRQSQSSHSLSAVTSQKSAYSSSSMNHLKPTNELSAPDYGKPYKPRPGVVLDDPEFKPGGGYKKPQHIITSSPVLPPGYGEIFDVTLSAIQGPGGGGDKAHKTINVKPFGHNNAGYDSDSDIIVAPTDNDGYVSIDGKRSYIKLFDETTVGAASTSSLETSSAIQPTSVITPVIIGTGYAVVETEPPIKPSSLPPTRYRHKPPQQPPVRIDTCIVGDDSTCDQAQNERCKTEFGVSSCHCKPGYARRKHREPCRKIVSILMSLRVDKIYDRKIIWDKQLYNKNSEAYGQLSYESVRAIDSAMSMTPFSDEFLDAHVNNIYKGNASQGTAGVFVNMTIEMDENGEMLRPNIKSDIQKHLLGVIHRRNNNIGNSVLYVDSPAGSISHLQDLDECTSTDLNDCSTDADCTNIWGSFLCQCHKGLRDPWFDQPQRAGRKCLTCPETYCNNRGTCSYDDSNNQQCKCTGNFYGSQCEIDGEVLGVSIGTSVAAVIIIVLTLVCLVMWSRKWQREQKDAMSSPVFGYMTGSQLKSGGLVQQPYHVTLEDRVRWAHMADAMSQQSNHYGVDPMGTTRPSSAMFGYPNLQMAASMGTLSIADTIPPHTGTLPPIPMPRYGLSLHNRSTGMRTLENSSSSEEEDRTDLLGRGFQVPRPRSRSNGSIANQSGIYYDVDYEPSPNSGVNSNLYGGTQTTNTATTKSLSGNPAIPMSTYSTGRVPQSYYK